MYLQVLLVCIVFPGVYLLRIFRYNTVFVPSVIALILLFLVFGLATILSKVGVEFFLGFLNSKFFLG